jgi:hypothetical protein
VGHAANNLARFRSWRAAILAPQQLCANFLGPDDNLANSLSDPAKDPGESLRLIALSRDFGE